MNDIILTIKDIEISRHVFSDKIRLHIRKYLPNARRKQITLFMFTTDLITVRLTDAEHLYNAFIKSNNYNDNI